MAIGDAIAALLCADCVAVLIGERPGLTAPDSMGAYLTWQPQPHTTDADRNCISNIRPDGIGYADAAHKLVHMLRAMHRGASRACSSKMIGSASGWRYHHRRADGFRTKP